MTPAYLLPPLRDLYAAFLRAIAAAPDDDTPRLVLADWLEERGAPERAEFIRVQCELAATPEPPEYHPLMTAKECSGHNQTWSHISDLRKRERELLTSHAGYWHGLPDLVPDVRAGEPSAVDRDRPAVYFRRGFIGTVRGPLGVLLGEPCGWCEGIGYRLLYAEDYPQCSRCRGAGRTPGTLERMGPELLAVRRADASDREPWVNLDRTHWGWWERTIHTGPDTLPPAVMDAMDDDPRRRDYGIGVARRKGRPTPGGCVLFGTETAARDALSRAVLAVARRRAGLEAAPANERAES